MSILSHRTVYLNVQPNGKQQAELEYTFSDGTRTSLHVTLPAGADVVAYRTARVPELETYAADAEARQLVDGL